MAFTTGGGPNSIVAAELTGDRFVDLATANQDEDTVGTFRNSGDGTFESVSAFDVRGESVVEFLTAADLDGEGDQDLAVVHRDTTSVSVLFNDGEGRLSLGDTYAVGDNPSSVAAADLDGRSGPDLIVTNTAGDNVSILLNTGGGVFDPAFVVPVGNAPVWVAAANLDGDKTGKRDLVVTNATSNSVTILYDYDLEEEKFTSGIDYRNGVDETVFTNPDAVVVTDLDCDTVPDLAVVNQAGTGADPLLGSVTVLLNRNLGPGVPDLFEFDMNYTVGRNPTCVVAADFNGDGAQDLEVTNHLDRSVSILINAGCPIVLAHVCRAAKLKAASKAAGGLLGCYAQAAKQAAAVDPLCVGKVRDKFLAAFAKAEAEGGCLTSQDAAPIGAQIAALAAAVADDLSATPGDKDANKCASAKLKATGKKAGGLLGCHARAAKKVEAIDPTCLEKVEGKLARAFSDAEARGECATTGDAAAIAAKVEASVVDVVLDLRRARRTGPLARPVTVDSLRKDGGRKGQE